MSLKRHNSHRPVDAAPTDYPWNHRISGYHVCHLERYAHIPGDLLEFCDLFRVVFGLNPGCIL